MPKTIATIILGLTITTCTCACDANPATVLSTLDKSHPRLLLKDAELQKLKTLCNSDPILKKCVADLITSADACLEMPSLKYKKIGPRLLSVSRDCLRRTYALALAWRWTGEKKYADKAVENLLIVCAFKDWNPSHFLDTAEMSHAVGVGYDWLYSYINKGTREKIREGLVRNGLTIGVAAYKGYWWVKSAHNWNQVCNSGLMIGALAVADTDPKYAQTIITAAIKSLPRAIKTYGPDGAWPEGVGYWHYATYYTVCGLAAMDSALGTDFGLSKTIGLDKAGLFPIYATGPTGMYINFADSSSRASRRPISCMFYLARKFKQAFLSDDEHTVIAKHPASPTHVMWYVPPSGKKTTRDLDRLFRGPVPVALFRSSWNDPNALFVGIKGGYNQVNHGHLDLGNFELDALGVRWSRDLGSENYNLRGYWDSRSETGRRWEYYRLNSQSHSIPLINGKNQSAYGKARILKFKAARPEPLVVIDLSSAYKATSKVTRGLKLLCNRKAVLVQDEFELTGEKPAEITWAMTTDAKIAIKSKTLAELTLDGKKLTARILSPSGAEFTVESAEQKPPQKSNKGVSRLLGRVKNAKGSVRITVLLTPAWEGFKPPATIPLTPLSKW
jgi:hypothetical protein